MFTFNLEVIYLSAGENHCAALDSQGTVFLWGSNTHGQCAQPTQLALVTTPTPLVFDLGVKQKTLQVSCGGLHTLVLNYENDVFAFGDNS